MPRPFELPCIFDPIEHAYHDSRGRRYRSVTQILADCDCVDFSMVDPFVLARAAERGTRVHAYTAKWDKIRGILKWDKPRTPLTLEEFFESERVHPDDRGYVRQYERFLQETGFIAIHDETERPRLVEIHNTIVGMTPDRVGSFPPTRQKIILDIKTGSYQLAHPLQLAGYSMGIERVMQLALQQERIALYLEENTYRLNWFSQQQDYYAFLDAINGGGRYLQTWKSHRTRKQIA
jgi:hypothetical protein